MTGLYIEAPTEYNPQPGERSVFLAGGISDCPNWQALLARRLAESGLVLLNPRRSDFPINDVDAGPAQVAWEYKHLRLADAILFWFCAETLNPIVLYELGAWSMTNKPIFVATDPEYKRCQDVELQTKLARPEVTVVHSLEELARQVEDWAARDKW